MNATRLIGGLDRICRRAGLRLTVLACGLVPLLAPRSECAELAIEWSYERWSLEGDEVSESSTQLTLDVALTEKLQVAVSTGYAAVEADAAANLSGAIDTRMRISYRPADQLALRAGINGPTGQSELSPTELATARLLSDRVLALPSRVLGQGFDADFGGAYSIGVGAAAIGLSAGYLVKGDFTPQEDGPEYRPGDRLSLAFGVDVGSPRWLLRNSVTYAHYAADEMDGAEFVQSGDTWEMETVVLRRWTAWTGWLSVGRLAMGDPDPRGSGLSEDAINARSEWEMALQAGAEMTGADWRVDGSAGVHFFSGSASDTGEARRFDVRAGSDVRLGSRLWGRVGGGLFFTRFGERSVELQLDEDAEANGFEVTLGLRSAL